MDTVRKGSFGALSTLSKYKNIKNGPEFKKKSLKETKSLYFE